MERAPRDFKGLWIPKEIWLSGELSLMEKVLFVEIHSLDNEHGCFASNRHFAEFFGVSERQIRTYIGSLRDKGFITVTIHNRNERTLRAAGKYARVHGEDLRTFTQGKASLVHRWSLPCLPGRKQTSGEGGRKVSRSPEGNFHRVIQE